MFQKMAEQAVPPQPVQHTPPPLPGKVKKAPTAQVPKAPPKPLKPVKIKPEETASDIIEEAFFILKTNARRLIGLYYIGVFPFAVALLYFINDMSMTRPGRREMEVYALLLTACFAWKNLFQSLFCRRIMNILNGKEDGHIGFFRLVRIFVFQNIVQPLGLIVQVLSLIFCITLGWTTAFFNTFTVVSALDEDGWADMFGSNWRLTLLNPRQNHVLLAFLSFLGLIVMINIGISLVVLPMMAKTFLGIDTVFSNASDSLLMLKGIFNLTFWSIVLTCTWLIVDPLLKTVYTLRVFYGESESRGYDIRARLVKLAVKMKNAKALWMMFVLFQVFAFQALGAEAISSDKLGNSIDETLKEREYKWQMPRKEKEAEDDSSDRSFIGDMIDKAGGWIADKFDDIRSWFDKYFSRKEKDADNGESGKRFFLWDWDSLFPFLLVLLLLGISFVLIVLWRRRRKAGLILPASAYELKSVPDIADDSTNADDLEKSAWLEMAGRLFEEGNFRLAVRAVFFAELCLLADERLLTLARFKTNREYLNELKRRAHSSKSIIDEFDSSRRIYERAWFGDYETGADAYAVIRDAFMKIKGSGVS